jgi:hypothetical protein
MIRPLKLVSLFAVLMLVGCIASSESVSIDDAKAATRERVDEPTEAGPVMTLERPK